MPGHPNWTDADHVIDFATKHNQRVRGHTLVWYRQLPAWIQALNFNADQLNTILIRHVHDEVEHFAGKIYAWDVVNEPLNDAGQMRNSIWYSVLGPAYIETALRAARQADPHAKLYINEYGIEGANPKRDALFQLIKNLKSASVPIDGVGLQGHFEAGKVPESFIDSLEIFASLDLDVAITELDIRISDSANPDALQQQAYDFKTVIDACLRVTRCVGITTWGVADRNSWIPQRDPGSGRALLFDDDLKPKPAYFEVVNAF
jgi:endo-1,4-beta-xylanase